MFASLPTSMDSGVMELTLIPTCWYGGSPTSPSFGKVSNSTTTIWSREATRTYEWLCLISRPRYSLAGVWKNGIVRRSQEKGEAIAYGVDGERETRSEVRDGPWSRVMKLRKGFAHTTRPTWKVYVVTRYKLNCFVSNYVASPSSRICFELRSKRVRLKKRGLRLSKERKRTSQNDWENNLLDEC